MATKPGSPHARKITVFPGGPDDESGSHGSGPSPHGSKKPLDFTRPELMDRQSIQEDPDSVHFPAENNKGASISLRLKVSPQMAHQIEEVVQSPIHPWRTDGEFMRCAAFLLLQDLSRIPAGTKLRTGNMSLELIAKSVREIMFTRELERTFETLEREMEQCLQDGDIIAAKIALTKVQTRISESGDLLNYNFGRRMQAKFNALKSRIKGL